MSRKHTYDERQQRQPVWVKTRTDHVMLIPVPHEEDMWLMHDRVVHVMWKTAFKSTVAYETSQTHPAGSRYLGVLLPPNFHEHTGERNER